MRKFFRSAAGKTLLFVICILSLIAAALSIAGIVVSFEYADILYLGDEGQFRNELFLRELKSNGYTQVGRVIRNTAADPDKVMELPDAGNAVFIVRNEQGNIIARSYGARDRLTWQFELDYALILTGAQEPGLGYDIWYMGKAEEPDYFAEPYDRKITVCYGMKDGFPEPDVLKLIDRYSGAIYRLRYAVYVLAVLAILAAVLCYIALMYVSGRRPDTEDVVPGPLNPVPFDILAAATAGAVLLALYVIDGHGAEEEIIFALILSVVALCLFIGLSMSFACRVKQRTLIRGSFIYRALLFVSGCFGALWGLAKRIFSYFMEGLRNLSVVWKTVLVFLGFTFLELMILAAAGGAEEGALFLAFERFLILPGIVITAAALRKLYKSGQALAAGDLSHYTDTKGMFWDLKRHGEDLNNIAKGMAIAVDERLKSERMKTELITNVSHDIKTPLTSIINYATLISEEESGNEKIDEYSEVLVRQSERLKRLIEDLVEASKASTGNLDVELVQCDAEVFLDQASGEYDDKLAASGLTLVTKAPEKEIRIMADGRRMWRIFDNLMNNICKYAMPGTRVYLSLEELDGRAVFTFKNTSRDELDISEEELMERFTRGDRSRNTEGNGLGLSIAKSLAELQNGVLELSIDGDLFKASVSFPVLGK